MEKAYAILRASAVVLSAMLLAGCAGTYDTADVLDGDSTDVITAGGSYDYSGDIKEPILIEAPGQEVTINLNNARIEPAIGSAIKVTDAAKIVINVPAGTQSSIIDSPKYAIGDDSKGCLFARCDITIAGGGILNVTGYNENAIACKDKLVIRDCEVKITSKRDGIRSNDGIDIDNCKISCESERHGFVTRKEGKDDKGLIRLSNSEISIIAGGFGIRSKTDLVMENITLNNNAVLGQFDVAGDIIKGDGCIINE